MTQTSTREEPHLEMELNGISFGIVVDSYSPSEPESRCEPAVSAEFEWHIIDEDGFRADDIMKEMTDSDLGKIEMYVFENSREVNNGSS